MIYKLFLIACLLIGISTHAMNQAKTEASSTASSVQASMKQFTLTVERSIPGNGLIENLTLQLNNTKSCFKQLRMYRIDGIRGDEIILAPHIFVVVNVGSYYESTAHKELLESVYEKANKKFLMGPMLLNDNKPTIKTFSFSESNLNANSSSSSSSSEVN